MIAKFLQILCLILFSLASLYVQAEDEIREVVDQEVEPYIKKNGFVGVAIGVVKDGKGQVFGYGETFKGSKQKPNGDTIYELGSISKVFTGVLLANAVNKGMVQLEDPVQKHLPSGVTMPIKDDQPIQLVHLATHTSGLPRLPENLGLSNPWNPYKGYSRQLMLDFLGEHTLRRTPGEYEYSNYALGLLGQLLAMQSETTYEELLEQCICEPLEMKNTGVTLNEQQKINLAPGYNTWFFQVPNWDLASIVGAGGIRSSANDMNKFIEAQFIEDDRPITQALIEARKVQYERDNGIALGLAWHISRDKTTWMHDGRTGGYTSFLKVIPNRKCGVVVLSNRSTALVGELGEKLYQRLFVQ